MKSHWSRSIALNVFGARSNSFDLRSRFSQCDQLISRVLSRQYGEMNPSADNCANDLLFYAIERSYNIQSVLNPFRLCTVIRLNI